MEVAEFLKSNPYGSDDDLAKFLALRLGWVGGTLFHHTESTSCYWLKKIIHHSDNLLKTSKYAFVGGADQKVQTVGSAFCSASSRKRKLSQRSWKVLSLYPQIFVFRSFWGQMFNLTQIFPQTVYCWGS